ncbi:MAG: PEP-CTERM sorting domain-containing protein [Steroidobacteraceae bacterium]
MFKKTFAVAGGLAAAVLAFSPLAQAGPLTSITFNLTGWAANTPGSTINSASQQADATNPLMTSANLFVTGTVMGLPNWCVGDPGCVGGSNTFGNFIDNNGNGGTTNSLMYWTTAGANTVLSSGGFASAALLKMTFTLANNDTMGTIVHDDGISIYNSMGTQVVDSALPTTATGTSFDLNAGTYTLYYVEANGAPSELSFQNVTEAPEPGALALFGAGLLGCALFIGRRRRMSRSI